jgi:hypothetical protein
VLELNHEVRDLYLAYEKKHVKPELALEIASDFTLDLINSMGDELSDEVPLKENWRPFAPFEFLLELNSTLQTFKESGESHLKESDRKILHKTKALLGALIRAALDTHPDSYPGEEHYQIPHPVAHELLVLSE